MNMKALLVGAALVGAVAVTGGSAFTAGNTGQASTKVLGYSSTTVSGGTVDSLAYTMSTDNSNVNSIALTLHNDTTGSTVAISFNTAAPISCGTGTFTVDHTDYTCQNGGSAYTMPTDTLVKTAVIITGP
jgi:hypothetical protein